MDLFAADDKTQVAAETNPMVPRLIAAFQGADHAIRAAAAAALGKTKDPRAVEPLITALRDQGTGAGKNVIEALGEIGDPRAVELLIAALTDKEPKIRMSVIEALGKIGDPQAVEPVIAALKVHGIICPERALAAFGPTAAAALIKELGLGDWELQRCAVSTMKIMKEQAVEPMLAALKDPDERIRKQVAEILGEIKEVRAVESLIAALKDESVVVRCAAAEGLGRIGDRRAVEPLAAYLGGSNDPAVDGIFDDQGNIIPSASKKAARAARDYSLLRRCAAKGLGGIGGPALDLLIQVFDDGNTKDRWAVVFALGTSGDPRAVEPLIAALKDQDQCLRNTAAEALGNTGDRRALAPLIAAFRDSDVNVRLSAAKSLCALKAGLNVYSLTDLLRDEAVFDDSAAVFLIKPDDPGAVTQFIVALKNPNAIIRAHAAEELGKTKDQRAVEPLLDALLDFNSKVRSKAVEALAAVGDPRAFYPLLDVLQDSDSTMVSTAAGVLAETHDPRVLEPLLALLKRSGNAEFVIRALGKTRDARAVRPLLGLLENREKCQGVADALADLGELAVPPLMNALGRNQSLDFDPTYSLTRIGEPAVASLVAALENPDLKSIAVETLGRIESPRTVEALVVFIKSGAQGMNGSAVYALEKRGKAAVEPLIELLTCCAQVKRIPIIEALGRIGDPRAVEPLMALLGNDDPNQQGVIINALNAIDPIWMFSEFALRVGDRFLAGLSSSDQGTRIFAALALGVLRDPRAVAPLLAGVREVDWDFRKAAVEALRGMDPGWQESAAAQAAISGFIITLSEGTDQDRIQTAEILGELSIPEAVAPLVAAVRNQNVSVSQAAAKALGALERRSAAEPLIAVLLDGDPRVRQAATDALLKMSNSRMPLHTVAFLGEMKNPKVVEFLISSLQDKDMKIRCNAVMALGMMRDPRVVDPIIAALDDKERSVVVMALNTLENLTRHYPGMNKDAWRKWWDQNKSRFLGKVAKL